MRLENGKRLVRIAYHHGHDRIDRDKKFSLKLKAGSVPPSHRAPKFFLGRPGHQKGAKNHIFKAMIPPPYNTGVRSGFRYCKAPACGAGGKERTAGSSVQTG